MAKTYNWTGTLDTDLGTAGNWDDVTDNLNPSPTVPGTLDTAEFSLTTGGTLSGSGTFYQAHFFGSTSPDWTIIGTVDAIGNGLIGVSAGTLTIAATGLVEGTDLNIGASLDMQSGAQVTLTGQASTSYLPTALYLDGVGTIDGGTIEAAGGVVNVTGDLTAGGGATVTALATSVFQYNGSTGTLTITGPDTTWHDIGGSQVVNGQTIATGYLGVGPGLLVISDHAAVTTDGGGYLTGGATTISGDAVWDVGTGINLDGTLGTASLSVLSGGTIHSTGAYDLLSGGAGNSSTAMVDGAGSTWSTSGALIVGNSGTGDLTVSNGGVVTATSLAVGQLNGGIGSLTIESGGVVDATGNGYGQIIVGNVAGSTGVVHVDAGGTLENTGTLDPNNYIFVIGGQGGSTGTLAASGAVYVDGTGALLTTGDNPLQLAPHGNGTLSVTDGAKAVVGVSSDASTADSALSVAFAGNGSVIVDGAGSSLTANNEAYFAYSGTASLTVSNDGTFIVGDSVYALNLGIGNASGTGGTATASVLSGGYVKSLSNINVGQGGDTATLDISGGGTVEAVDLIRVGKTNTISGGAEAGGTGVVNIGAGGTLVADGSSITASGTAAIRIGDGIGSTGSVDVAGAGALLDGSGHYLSVGNHGGTGTLTVRQGGSVAVGAAFSGDAAVAIGSNSGTGLLEVTGSLSTVTAYGQMDVGTSGTAGAIGAGSLDVENGGTVVTGGNPISAAGGLVIAWGSSSTGSVTVNGAGSEIINVGQFNVGGGGNSGQIGGVGTMLIEDGGLVETGLPASGYTGPAGDVAARSGTGGSSVTVTGTDSTWEVGGALLVGDAAAGSLSISHGGTVTADSLEAGVQAGSDGVIDVSGDSTLDIIGAATIGVAGSASLSLYDGTDISIASMVIGTLGTVSLAGLQGTDQVDVSNAGLIEGYGSLAIDLTNTGTVVALGGTLASGGPITGSGGSLVIDNDSAMTLGGSISGGQTLDFAGTNALLTLQHPDLFGATIVGFQDGDIIHADGATSGSLSGDLLTLFSGAEELAMLTFATVPTGLTVEADGDIIPCFLAGTRIRTDRGETPVEQLRIGDRVQTLSGALRPIKWLGHRSYRRPFAGHSDDIIPMLIRAGALADGVPARDLHVSPLHALLLDDVLIPAGALRNGVTILARPDIEAIDYVHIELDLHDVILAEGAPAETFVDCDSRAMFHNANEFARLYPGDTAPRWAFCAPRVTEGMVLDQVRARLAARAGLQPPGQCQGGELLGYLEVATHRRIAGWAWQKDHPDSPPMLEILCGDGVIARVVADQDRPDVRDAGFGDGRCGFDLTLQHGFSAAGGQTILVRRAADRAVLPGAPVMLEPLPAPRSPAALEADIAALQQARWNRLAEADSASNLLVWRRRGVPGRPRVLVVDEASPRPDRDAGSNAVISHMRALLDLGWQVEFVAAGALDAPPAAALLAMGVVCHHAPVVASVEDVLRHGAYDVVYLHRLGVAAVYAALVRSLCPQARLIYALADLHHLRLARQAEVERRPDLLARARAVRLAELFAISQAHAVLTHSAAEAEYLARVAPGAEVHVVPWAATVQPTRRPLAEREGVAFIGWHGHAPNADAVRWLTSEIMPLVWARVPEMPLTIVGEGWAERMPAGLDPRIRVPGAVERLAEVFDRARLTVAPLRFGAGLKGKVLDSLAGGLPCVMTPIAAEGFPLADAPVAGDAAGLAGLIWRMHEDSAANARAAAAGLALADRAFTPARVTEALGRVVARPPVPVARSA